MSATPKYGSLVFIGASGKTYEVDMYVSDVAAGAIQFDQGAGASATSGTFWRTPENVTLVDYAQVTGTADTEKWRLTLNGRPTFNLLRYDTHVSTASTRPPLNIKIAKGVNIAGIQIAD